MLTGPCLVAATPCTACSQPSQVFARVPRVQTALPPSLRQSQAPRGYLCCNPVQMFSFLILRFSKPCCAPQKVQLR